jgi:hypothetical protein
VVSDHRQAFNVFFGYKKSDARLPNGKERTLDVSNDPWCEAKGRFVENKDSRLAQ